MKRTVPSGCLIVALSLACQTPGASARLVRTTAARDFGCDSASIVVEERSPLWLAKGCDKEDAYGVATEWFGAPMMAIPCHDERDAGIAGPPSEFAKECEVALKNRDGG